MLATLIFAAMTPYYAQDVLPDIGVWEEYLANAFIGTTSSSEPPAGRRCIRLDSVSVNFGPGRFELRGGETVGGQQRVYQRVFRDDATFYDREAGWFVFHPSHGHIHFDNWTIFRLRQMNPDGSVGAVVRTGQKTSFCILELLTYDSSLPGYNTPPSYSGCGQLQGLRPGRADIYSSSLTDQYVDIVGVPDGLYYLECVIDPADQVLEFNETNNVSRVPFAIGSPPPTLPDVYEENDTRAQVDGRPEGGANSPNLGLVLSNRFINNLSLNDEDWFKVKLHATDLGDFVKAASPYLHTGNFSMQLLNSAGSLLRSSSKNNNYEYISLAGLGAGTYYVRVFNTNATPIPNYSLEIEPGGNLPPTVTLSEPAAPGMWVERSLETFPVTWLGSDPEQDPKFVSLFLTPSQNNNANAFMIPGYQNMPGNMGTVNVNTVGLPLGKSWVMARASDGGAYSEAWAPGYVGIYKKGDLNFDNKVTSADVFMLRPFIITGDIDLPEGWNFIADMNRSGLVNRTDYIIMMILAGMIDG